ncbi:MAG: DUF192 domain-containing protein [Pseudomonadota bacterium]
MRRTMVIILVSIAAACGCRSGGPEAPRRAETRGVEILGPSGEVLGEVQVEVVSSPDATARGLKYRDEVPEGTGMLFVFPEDIVRSFWMQDTRVSLDILFIDRDGGVVGIRRNTEPYSEASITVGVPSRYVLEVPAGTCSRKGIHRGARVVLPF